MDKLTLLIQLTLSRFCPILLAALIGMAPLGAVAAEGSAVFASVTTTNREFELKAQIGVDFGVDVRATTVWVNQVKWIRLQSSIMPEGDARALVSRALGKGYDAWYDSSGNRWADTREKSGGSAQATTYRSNDRGYATSENTAAANAKEESYPAQSEPIQSSRANDWGIVKPATGDVSHLPLAETFPIE